MSKPKAPSGLGTRGRKFWRQVVDEFELSAPETELLTEAARELDQIDALEAAVAEHGVTVAGSEGQPVVNRAIPALNASRGVLRQLLSAIDMPDEDGKSIPTAGSVQRRGAAKSRWAGHDKSQSVRNDRKTNVVSIDGAS